MKKWRKEVPSELTMVESRGTHFENNETFGTLESVIRISIKEQGALIK